MSTPDEIARQTKRKRRKRWWYVALAVVGFLGVGLALWVWWADSRVSGGSSGFSAATGEVVRPTTREDLPEPPEALQVAGRRWRDSINSAYNQAGSPDIIVAMSLDPYGNAYIVFGGGVYLVEPTDSNLEMFLESWGRAWRGWLHDAFPAGGKDLRWNTGPGFEPGRDFQPGIVALDPKGVWGCNLNGVKIVYRAPVLPGESSAADRSLSPSGAQADGGSCRPPEEALKRLERRQ